MIIDVLIAPMTYLGLVAAAVSGVIEARRKNMDIVGACAVGLITALGGGTLRDLLLGRLPVFWIKEEIYAIVVLAVIVITFYSSRLLRITQRTILVPDAIGLGMFSILGATISLQLYPSIFIAGLMGLVTGVFGGILRDIICNEIPSVFILNSELYTTCSFLGIVVFLGLHQTGLSQPIGLLAGILVTVLTRILAVRYKIRLPNP